MSTQYLFNSKGEWIAFRVDQFLFDKETQWIGWLPWGDNHVVTEDGEYLGTIYNDRFYEITNPPYRGFPGYPGYPGNPGYPGYPGFAGYSPLPLGAKDIEMPKK